jgi:hypothetical protein
MEGEAKFCHECMCWRTFVRVWIRELNRYVWICRVCGSEMDEILEYLRIGGSFVK